MKTLNTLAFVFTVLTIMSAFTLAWIVSDMLK